MKVLPLILLAACGGSVVQPSTPAPLPSHSVATVDTSPKERPRLLAQEPYLRAYLMWFGGLAPLDVQKRARTQNLFDSWDDYLASLGIPDYRQDLPRASQSNALMITTLSRLGEALCAKAAEHDLGTAVRSDERLVFAFEPKPSPTRDEFAPRFDVLHRLFLSYPAALGPPGRVGRYYRLYRDVAARYAATHTALVADRTGWIAVCAALVQHPEASLY